MPNSLLLRDQPKAHCNSFSSFKASFAPQDNRLFDSIFDRNRAIITIKKRHVAVSNLQKLFASTFVMAAQIGFHKMSLRDLSLDTGLSIGSIYACIGKKENLAIIVKDVIEQLTHNNITQGSQDASADDAQTKLEHTIRLHFFTSTLLQPWYSFLYLETRSLSDSHQMQSIQIELDTLTNLSELIEQGITEGCFETEQPAFAAQAILALLQDWYLKPWKHHYEPSDIDAYLDNLLNLVRALLNSTHKHQIKQLP